MHYSGRTLESSSSSPQQRIHIPSIHRHGLGRIVEVKAAGEIVLGSHGLREVAGDVDASSVGHGEQGVAIGWIEQRQENAKGKAYMYVWVLRVGWKSEES